MSTLSIGDAVADLIEAPMEAALAAEEKYLQLWKERLEIIQKTYVQSDGQLKEGASLEKLLKQYTPVVEVEGKIEMGLTMRIAGVTEKSGSFGGGLAVGPIHGSGSFGFASQNTHESVFQVSAAFVVANKKFSLEDYLSTAAITLAEPGDLTMAIEHLGKDLASRKPQEK